MTRRSLLRITSGTIASDPAVVAQAYAVMHQEITSFLTNGEQAWEFWDQVNGTAGSTDRIYHSVGHHAINNGAGDISAFLRMRQISATNISVTCYQDWASTSNDGNSSFVNNAAGHRPSGAEGNASMVFASSTAEIRWWAFINEYSIAFYFRQSAASDGFAYSALRPPAPPQYSGKARIITSTTGSGDVTLELDRELSGTMQQKNVVQPGQKIWLVNQSPTGSILLSGSEIAYVTSVGNNKLSLSNVTNTYQSSSIIGVECNTQTIFSFNTSPSVISYLTPETDNGYVVAGNSPSSNESILSALFFGANDPTASGFFVVAPTHTNVSTGINTGMRGYSDSIIHATYDNSIHSAGTFLSSSKDIYCIFPETAASGRCIGFGPLDTSSIGPVTASMAVAFNSGSWKDSENILCPVWESRQRVNEWNLMEAVVASDGSPTVDVILPAVFYYQRAVDVGGTGGYVYWTTRGTPNPTPAATETTPNFTGTLQSYTVVRILREN